MNNIKIHVKVESQYIPKLCPKMTVTGLNILS